MDELTFSGKWYIITWSLDMLIDVKFVFYSYWWNSPESHFYDLLVQRYERDPFLKRLVVGDEILYQTVHRKRISSKDLQLSRSLDFTQRKFFHPFDEIGKVERVPQDETINSAKYCNQLDKLKAAIAEKRAEPTRLSFFITTMQNRMLY